MPRLLIVLASVAFACAPRVPAVDADAPKPTSPEKRTSPSDPPAVVPPTEDRPQSSSDAAREMQRAAPAFDPGAVLRWEALDEKELALLSSYHAFSSDGRLYAYAERPPAVDVDVLTILNLEDTEEEATVLPLGSDLARRNASQVLGRRGFPPPGAAPDVPPMLGVRRDRGAFVVTVNAADAGPAFEPFEDVPGARTLESEIVAVSPDGGQIAVRSVGRAPDGSPLTPEHRVLDVLAAAPPVPRPAPAAPPGRRG